MVVARPVVRVRVRARVRVRVRIKLWVRVRVWVRARLSVRVRVQVRARPVPWTRREGAVQLSDVAEAAVTWVAVGVG